MFNVLLICLCDLYLQELIVDLEGVGMRTFSQWTPALVKKSVLISEKALPLRLKSSHLLSVANGFETAYSIFQMFISEKWKKRVRNWNHFKKSFT